MYLDVFYNKKITIWPSNVHFCELLRRGGRMKNHGKYINVRFRLIRTWSSVSLTYNSLSTSLSATSTPKAGFFMHFHASWLLMSVTNALKRIFRKGIMNKLKIRIETYIYTNSQEQNETNRYQSCKYLFFYKAVLKQTNNIIRK
jgi:hypothetical protein